MYALKFEFVHLHLSGCNNYPSTNPSAREVNEGGNSLDI